MDYDKFDKREITNEVKKYVFNNALVDVLKFSTISLPIIMFFELYMIVNWFVNFDHTFEAYSFSYLVCYVSLFIISAVVWIYTIFHKKQHLKNYKAFNVIQILYGFIFILWALAITYQDQTYRDSFSVIIYVTIITIVPLLCYINPRIWALLEVITYLPMVFMASREDHFVGFVINFTVFIIISIIAEYSSYNIRRANYIKQYNLELLQQKDHFYAYYDMDTGLKNRRSFVDDTKKIEMTDDLIVGVFDIQELKNINMKFGTNLGDQLLNGTTKILTDLLSEKGEVYRISGDDFCFIGKDIDIIETKETINKKAFEWNGFADTPLKIISGFAAHTDYPELNINDLLKVADQALSKE